ncbi:MAG: FxLYD domain-containing protein [Clostridia bacterium]|nr:FxLYD domain-containing protein [Clostridia bacterium]
MKKAVLILLALAMVFSLAACGGGGSSSGTPSAPDTPSANTPDTPATPAESTEPAQEPAPAPSAEPAKEVDYEITYVSNTMWVNSIGTTWEQTIVEITNTGSKPLYLNSASYDLEDESGSLLSSESMVSFYPTVVDVGEKAYMYNETTFDGAPVENVTVLPHIKAEKAKIDNTRYPVSDIKISEDSLFGIKVIGRIENNTSEDLSMPEIAVVLYNAAGEPIGVIYTYVMDGVPAGEKVGFEASGVSLPDSVTADAIADYVAFAYPGLQIQF